MLKKPFKSLKRFFTPLRTSEQSPRLRRPPVGMAGTTLQSVYDAMVPRAELTEAQHRENMESIELARLSQERETANNNLAAQHRTTVVTAIATLIALFSSVAAIFIALNQTPPAAPVVNVTPAQQAPPDVKVYVTPQTTESTPETPR